MFATRIHWNERAVISAFDVRREMLRISRFLVVILAIFVVVGANQVVCAAPGSIDPTFGDGAGVTAYLPDNTAGWAKKALIDSSGRLVMTGVCNYESEYFFCVMRLTASGQLDATFGVDGVVRLRRIGSGSSAPQAIAQMSDGKVIVIGMCELNVDTTTACTYRLNENGEIDATFGPNFPSVYAAKIIPLADGKALLLTPRSNGFCVRQILSSGSPDTSFSATNGSKCFTYPPPFEGAVDMHRLVDGSYVVMGQCRVNLPPGSMFASTTRICVAKLTSSFAKDPGFGATNGSGFVLLTFNVPPASDYFDLGLAVTSDAAGRIVILGACESYFRTCLARLQSDGSLDASFGVGSQGVGRMFIGFNFGENRGDKNAGSANSYSWMHIDGMGRIVLIGGCENFVSKMCISRLLDNGGFDTTFDAAPGNGNGIARHQPATFFSGAWANHGAVDLLGRYYAVGKCNNIVGRDPFCAVRIVGGDANVQSCTLNTDANSAIAASSDAMLVTRYLLGFRGDALTSGAIGANPGRTAEEIVTYLDALKNDPLKKLDLDGDGESLAMTDGLLMLRAMLGLSGEALTAGAINTAHPNVRDAKAILTWIETTHGLACLP
jgi:uncharacterized delta-60 repeat protein